MEIVKLDMKKCNLTKRIWLGIDQNGGTYHVADPYIVGTWDKAEELSWPVYNKIWVGP